jgi:ABC-type amino acid transport substrate-binding protein
MRRLVRAFVASIALVLVAGCANLGGGGGGGGSDHGHPAATSTRLQQILETGKLRVGMSGEQPPLNMTSHTGELVGLEVALARVLAATIGVQLDLVRIPFPRLLDALDAGIQLVIQGKADALVADQEICYFAMLRHDDVGLAVRADTFTVEPIGIALPPHDHQFTNLIENYLNALEMQGTLERARQFWFEDKSWVKGLE